MPTLSVVVFGALDRTPDTKRIAEALLEFAKSGFPASEEDGATNPIAVRDYCQRLVNKKLQVIEAPSVSEMVFSDSLSRLFSIVYALRGSVWLLLEEGAGVSETNARRIPAVLSEFARNPAYAVVQGAGYHAFVREDFMMGGSVRPGKLAHSALRAGVVAKRIRYITLDARRSARFEL